MFEFHVTSKIKRTENVISRVTKVVRGTEIISIRNWNNIKDFVAFQYAQDFPLGEYSLHFGVSSN